MNKILLKNGNVVNSKKSEIKDILIVGEKIKKVSKNITPDKNTIVIDCSGKYIFPGFIDGHTHFDLSVAGTTTIDDFQSGTLAAITGGTTTIIDYGTQYKGETLSEGLKNWKQKAANGVSCDYGIHMSISDVNKKSIEDIKLMIKEGVTSFKLYTTYDIKLNDSEMNECMKAISKNKGIVGVHCENDGLIADLRNEVKGNDNKKVISHRLTRPNIAEAEAVNRMAYIANYNKCAFLAVHVTCKEALEEVKLARKRGYEVYAETCPQYLMFDESVYKKNFSEASKYVIAPPLREKSNIDYLWKAINDGDIDIVSTDHCSFTKKQKELGKNDFRKIPGGLNGVEHRGVIMFDAVLNKKISKEKMCEVLAENPSYLFGLWDKKGFIKEGYDADIVIFDPKTITMYNDKNQMTKSDYCVFDKKQFKGAIEKVFLRGNLVVESIDNGKTFINYVVENKGKFLKRKTYKKIR